MIKQEYIELVQRRLAGGEVTSDVRGKFHENVVSRYIAMAFNTYLFDLVRVARATRDFSTLDVYTRDFIIPKKDLKTDDIRGQQFIDIPSPLPQVLGNNAIRYFGSAKVGSRGYLYRNPSAHDVMGELDVEIVDQNPRYSPESTRLYFILLEDIPANFRLSLITDYEGFPDDENLPLPGGQDLPLFAQIIQLMKGGVEEIRNDNVINEESPESSR